MHRIIALTGLTLALASAGTARAQVTSTDACAPERGRVSIAGVVRDSAGLGMPNVLVRAYGPETDSVPTGPVKLRTSSARVLKTDSTGAFCLRDLAPGRYIVNPRRMMISRDDFNELEVAVDVSTPDLVHRIDVAYDPQAMSLAEQARREALRTQLAEHRARWNAQRPEKYRARITFECFCAVPPGLEPSFVVHGDSIAQVTNADTLPVPPGLVETWPAATIDRVFERVEAALADPQVVVQEIQFHPELGFPILLRTDARRPLTDTQTTLRVPLFEALGAEPSTGG